MTIQDQIQFSEFNEDVLSFYRAIGIDMVCLDIRFADDEDMNVNMRGGADSTEFFERARDKVEAQRMELFSVFMAGWDEITFGTEDRDEKIEAWCTMVRSLGNAGVKALGYNFKPMGNFRTASLPPGRGGTSYSTFDYAEFDKSRPAPHEPQVSEEEIWSNMEVFLQRVIPVAEASGVQMALHPDDPPIPEPLAGVAQIVSNMEQYQRIFDASPSDSNGMLFCQGCVTEMGLDVYETIRRLGTEKKIVYVHFRNVRGALPSFQEVFLDEGDVDMYRALSIYSDVGFNGPFMMDHTPGLPNRELSSRAGRAYAVGYIRALTQAVYR